MSEISDILNALKFGQVHQLDIELTPEQSADLLTHIDDLHFAVNEQPELTARITELEQELNTTDGLLKEATETIGAVVACCTYNSNDDAKIGIYGIEEKQDDAGETVDEWGKPDWVGKDVRK